MIVLLDPEIYILIQLKEVKLIKEDAQIKQLLIAQKDSLDNFVLLANVYIPILLKFVSIDILPSISLHRSHEINSNDWFDNIT